MNTQQYRFNVDKTVQTKIMADDGSLTDGTTTIGPSGTYYEAWGYILLNSDDGHFANIQLVDGPLLIHVKKTDYVILQDRK
jgi:hypothetical protein